MGLVSATVEAGEVGPAPNALAIQVHAMTGKARLHGHKWTLSAFGGNRF